MQIITLISDFGVRLNRARYKLFISYFYELFSRQSSAIKLNSLNFDECYNMPSWYQKNITNIYLYLKNE